MEIPNSVTLIGGHAFSGCSSLTSVYIPNSVTSIRNNAFNRCSSLTSVYIPNSVTLIGGGAFSGCSSLTSVEIPNSVTSIGNNAFENCSSLTSVYIPNSVTSIRMYTFYNCSSLISVEIPNSVKSIGEYAFSNCSSLTTVEIPNSVTSIGVYAFSNCSSLTSIEIPNSVTSIGISVFSHCFSLTSVVIPNSVTSIDGNAFRDCSSLKEITSLAFTPPSISSYTFEGVSKMETLVKVPDESVDAYKSAEHWSTFWNIVGLNGQGGGEDPNEPTVCAKPEIAVVDGKLAVTCATEGAVCHTSVVCNDGYSHSTRNGETIELKGEYSIISYATAEGMSRSETVSATLVWVNPALEGSNIYSMEAKKAVLIRTIGGRIVVNGTERGERISVYSLDGRELLSTTAADGETALNCQEMKGAVVIVKYGGKSVKIRL